MSEIENFRTRLNEEDSDDIYSTIIDIGRAYCYELVGEIVSYLSHEDPMLRSAAIRVLAFYWQMEEYKSVAENMFMNKAENEEVRSVALMSWGIFFKGTNNRFAIEKLYKILSDRQESNHVRATAYGSLLSMSALPLHHENSYLKDFENIDKSVKWDLIEKIRDAAE